MNCRIDRRWVLAAALALIVPVGADGGVGTATVTFVHGINGTDVTMPEAAAVDVNVNGVNALAGVTFRSFSDALVLPDGMASFEISWANAGDPGSNPPIASVTADLAAGLDYSLFAHLDLLGDPTLSAYFNDLSQQAGRNSFRQFVRHGAVAPVIDVIWYPLAPNNPPLGVLSVANSQSSTGADFGARPYFYDMVVEEAATGAVLVGPLRFSPRRRVYYFNYLVGSEANGTLEVLMETRGGR